MKMDDEAQGLGLVKVHVVEDHFEAEILLGALRLEGIECVCKTHEEIAYNGLFVLQRGWGAILVRADQAHRAREIIEEVLRVYGKRPNSGDMKPADDKTNPGSGPGGKS